MEKKLFIMSAKEMLESNFDDGLNFRYLDCVQRSPEWFAARLGRVTASRLEDWMGVSKAKGKEGQPLKARSDYETELAFELQFGTNYNKFVSEAMQDGVEFEDFTVAQYEKITGNKTEQCGCWYDTYFVASPDRTVGDDGLLEIKVLRDTNWMEVLLTGVPENHMKQVQGQLWATGRKWCDYAAINLNTKKLIILRVKRDDDMIKLIAEKVKEPITKLSFDATLLHDVIGALPDFTGTVPGETPTHTSNTNKW